MEKIYNKLVRDNIPEIIGLDKRKPIIRVLTKEEFISELFKKLIEEAKESVKAKNNKAELIKEIGDIYEVIDAIIGYYNLDRRKITKVKEKRKAERGGFKKRIFLESIDN